MTRQVLRRVGLPLVLVLGTVAATAACGDNEGSASGGSGTASGSGTGVGGCEAVGDGDGTKVKVTLDEWKVTASPDSVAAGKVTFDVHNEGHEAHEMVVVRAASPKDLKVVEGKVDEDALPKGDFIGEVEAFPAGQECDGTFDLAAGSYVLFCNIVEEHHGDRHSHFEEGMATTFVVT